MNRDFISISVDSQFSTLGWTVSNKFAFGVVCRDSEIPPTGELSDSAFEVYDALYWAV